MQSAPDDAPEFTAIDWDDHEAESVAIQRRTVAFGVELAALAAVALYDHLVLPSDGTLPLGFAPSALDYLTLLAVLVAARYGAVPLARNPTLTRRYWNGLRRRPLALAALAYLAAFTAVGVLGPVFYGPPSVAYVGEPADPRGAGPQQPPAFASVPVEHVIYCDGAVEGGRCHGTTSHPLGTTQTGEDVLAYLIYGAGVVVKIALVAGALLVPLSTAAGTVAAAVGGRVEEAVVAYLDFQQVLPAVVAYLLYQFLYRPSLLAIVVLFGLLDWDRVARQVRNDARRKTDAGYVLAARGAGESTLGVVRRHLVPNVANTVVAAVALQIPFVVAAEVTLTVLGLTRFDSPSWGVLISLGLGTSDGAVYGMNWWSVLFPTVALAVTMGALALLGDALRDVLDPRGETR